MRELPADTSISTIVLYTLNFVFLFRLFFYFHNLKKENDVKTCATHKLWHAFRDYCYTIIKFPSLETVKGNSWINLSRVAKDVGKVR